MLAENLVLLRNMRALSQEYVAEIAGVSRQSYAKWEQGETILDIEKCDRLARFYQISLDALVHHSNMVGTTSIPPGPCGKASLGNRDRWQQGSDRHPQGGQRYFSPVGGRPPGGAGGRSGRNCPGKRERF